METITSLKNPKVQAWKSLKDKKGREEQHAFLVEGPKMVQEALASGLKVKAVFALPHNAAGKKIRYAVKAHLSAEVVFNSFDIHFRPAPQF